MVVSEMSLVRRMVMDLMLLGVSDGMCLVSDFGMDQG